MVFTRRQFLGATAVASTAAVAGCLDDVPLMGGQPDFASWIPADTVLDSGGSTVTFFDLRALRDWPDDPLPPIDDDTMFGVLGIEEEDIDGIVDIMTDDGISSITLGSFDLAEFEEAMEDQGGELVDDYEGFDIYEWGGTELAIGEEALLLMGEYEDYIDVFIGNEPQVADEDDIWAEGIDSVGSYEMVNLEVFGDNTFYDYQEALELLAAGVKSDGDEYFSEGYYFFADADDAEAAFDEIEAELDGDGNLEDYALEIDGATIAAEATFAEFDVPRF